MSNKNLLITSNSGVGVGYSGKSAGAINYFNVNPSQSSDIDTGIGSTFKQQYSMNGWPQYYYPNDLTIEKMRKAMEKMSEMNKPKKKEQKMSTLELFSNKDDEQKLLEEYNIVDETGELTQTGWSVLGKLLLVDKKAAIVETLKADKEAKKNKKSV